MPLELPINKVRIIGNCYVGLQGKHATITNASNFDQKGTYVRVELRYLRCETTIFCHISLIHFCLDFNVRA